MKKSLMAILGLALIGISACKKNNSAPSNTGSVQFVNGCAGTTPGVDAKVDDINVSGALNLSYTSYSGYKYVKSGSVSVAYYLTNSGTPVTAQAVNVENGKYYTAFCAGLITAPSLYFVQDDRTAPAQGDAMIRFVNLSNDPLSVTANAQTSVIGTAILSHQVTAFMELKAGSYELKAGDPADISTVVTTSPKTQTLAAGHHYTLMLTGAVTGTGESALRLTLIDN